MINHDGSDAEYRECCDPLPFRSCLCGRPSRGIESLLEENPSRYTPGSLEFGWVSMKSLHPSGRNSADETQPAPAVNRTGEVMTLDASTPWFTTTPKNGDIISSQVISP